MSGNSPFDGYRVDALGVAAGSAFATASLEFELKRGQSLALVGPGGSGKTLLFEQLASIRRPEVRAFGTASQARVQLLPQDPRLSVLPTDRVWTLLHVNPWALRLERITGYRPQPPTHEQQVIALLKRLRLSPARILELPFRVLSASERVRVLACATLLSRPEVLLIDGWNETLDATDRRILGEILDEERERGLIVIVSSRSYPLPNCHVDEVIYLTRDDEPDQQPVPLLVKTETVFPHAHALLEVERLVVEHRPALLAGRQPSAVVVDGASLFVRHGEVVALLGPAGSGKSALLEAIVGLSRPSRGAIRFAGHDVTFAGRRRRARLRRNVQLVFQDAAAVLDGRRDVGDHLDEARALAKGKVAKGDEWLEKLGLSPRLLDLPADQLSASESQRVDLARSLILSPTLVLLDGPEAGGVDTDGGIMAALIAAEKAKGRSFLVATSHPETARALADRVFVFHAGRVVEMGSKSAVLDTPAHPVTLALVEQRPLEPFDPTATATGCAYVDHCDRRKLPLCQEREPMLAPLASPGGPAAVGTRRVACFVPIGGEPTEDPVYQSSAPPPPSFSKP